MTSRFRQREHAARSSGACWARVKAPSRVLGKGTRCSNMGGLRAEWRAGDPFSLRLGMSSKLRAVLTDSHFWAPLIMLALGIVLLAWLR
jgi:hypothetical protein